MILKVAASGYLTHLPFGAIGTIGLHEAECTLEFKLHPYWLALELLVGGQHGLLGLEMQPSTYRTVIGKYFQRPVRPPQAAPVPTNVDSDEVPRYIQLHAS